VGCGRIGEHPFTPPLPHANGALRELKQAGAYSLTIEPNTPRPAATRDTRREEEGTACLRGVRPTLEEEDEREESGRDR